VKRNSKMGRTKDKRRKGNKRGIQQSIKTQDHRNSKGDENDKGKSKKKREIRVIWRYTSKTSEDQL